MKPPFRLAWSHDGDADPAGPRPSIPAASLAVELDLDLDDPEALDVALDDLDTFAPDDEALQEIAEQTPYGEVLLEDLMRRQRRLAISVGAVFLVVLLGLP